MITKTFILIILTIIVCAVLVTAVAWAIGFITTMLDEQHQQKLRDARDAEDLLERLDNAVNKAKEK